MWNQIQPPDGYNGPCFEMGSYLAVSKLEENSLHWSVLQRADDGSLTELSGVWVQNRFSSNFGQSEIEQGLGWAESLISDRN